MADKVYTDNSEATEAWNGVLFDRWRDFRDVFVTALEGLSDDAFASDPPKPGDRAIDLGCGFGETTLQLAEMVGPDGTAVGVDVADRFIEQAREEAAAAGVEAPGHRRCRDRTAQLFHRKTRTLGERQGKRRVYRLWRLDCPPTLRAGLQRGKLGGLLRR